MARKKKNRKKQMPPLSWVDKVVYWVAMILSFCGIWVILPVLLLQRHIAFQDNTVIASSEGPVKNGRRYSESKVSDTGRPNGRPSIRCL